MRQSLKVSLTLVLLVITARVYAFDIPYQAWMGAYVGEKKIGYLSYVIEKSDLTDGSVYKITSVMNNRLTVLGADLTQLITTTIYTDGQYTPLKETFAMSSGGKTTAITAAFTKDKIVCEVSAGSGSSTQTVPIPAGVSLVGDAMLTIPGTKVEIGKDQQLYYFNPLTLSIDKLTMKVEGKEKITVDGKEHDAFIVLNSTAMGDMKVWEAEDGDVFKIQAMMGIVMLRESKEKATAGLQAGKGEDFADATSLKADRPISNPRTTRALDIVIKGISEPGMIITDKRQQAAKLKGHDDWVRFTIKASPFDADKSQALPIKPASFKSELSPSAYINCDVQAIRDQSQQIVGEEKNAYRAAAKLREWVFANMKPRADIGITRSASDVLQSKVGVCRDYAILLAGLARAAGIPSRLATGVLYTNGAFYYHVWVECYVGQWVSLDATLPTNFVDATHIKMAEGDATSMFGLSKVIGSLKAEIKSYK